jgi:hypothetical protein
MAVELATLDPWEEREAVEPPTSCKVPGNRKK